MSAELGFLDNYKAIRRRLWSGHIKEVKPERVDLVETLPEPAPEPEPERDLLLVASFGFVGGQSLRQQMREAVKHIAARHGIDAKDIMSDRRNKQVVRARHEAIYYVKQHTTWSTPQIGTFFGGRDHTTVLHAIKQHRKRMREGRL